MNKNVKSIFFVLTIIILLCAVGAVSATDDTNNSISDITTSADTSSDSTITELQTTHNEKQVDIKSIEKENKNTKTESKTITLNSNTFDEYVTDGKFNEKVSDGDTIDIQGKLEGSRFALEINKPVNMISSNGEGYINFHTGDYGAYGEESGGIFKITHEGSGTNITNIHFYNTHVRIENTSNVNVNNISLINEHAPIGQNVGAISIREGSEHISITNSYFKTWDNGGHSNVVFAAAYNCLFENNTVEGYRSENPTSIEGLGNLLYLTTYNLEYATPATNINITIRNNTIRSKNVPAGFAIHYGLCLEGKGHLIENNYIDTNYPVMAQYADAAYGMETNIDEIIFRNNVIVRGNPQLIFPGTVTNNTFGEKATLNQVKAYDNIFNNVTIENNCIFENNKAKDLEITGSNNTLSNNEVYSNENYAVTVTGTNNTLSDNKFASLNGRGENAISNSTEFISLNNSEDISRIFYVNDDNCLNYFYLFQEDQNWYKLKENFYRINDFISLNTSKIERLGGDYELINLSIQIDTNPESNISLYLDLKTNLTIVNTYEPKMTVYTSNSQALGGPNSKILINSTVLKATNNTKLVLIDSEVMAPQSNIVSDYSGMASPTTYLVDRNTGYFVDAIISGSQLYLHKYDSGGVKNRFANNITVDRAISLTALPTFGNIEFPVNILEGSGYSNFTNITFDGKVTVKTSNINFINCTFNNELVFDEGIGYIVLEGNNINNNISLTSVNDVILNNNVISSENIPVSISSSRKIQIENNTIITNNDNTIVFDDESSNNVVKNNVLIAGILVGDESIVSGDNIVEDNTPSYNTSIIISSEEYLLANDVSTVNITVYNTYNDTPVEKGYVEFYFDGILQGIKTLVNGQTSFNINTNQSELGSVPLKVWYYDGIKYANNVTSINVPIVKSNVTISIDEFTAKMNEKATTNITFLNQKGNPVQDTNITVTVGSTTYTIETTDGVATLDELVTIEWLDSGRMTIIFPDMDIYNRNITTITLNTSKDDITPTINFEQEDNKVTVNMELVDSLNNPVTDGKITITTIDGTQLNSSRIRNGTYNSTITLPEDYTENLIINYTNSYYYNDFTQELELQYNIIDTITKITLPEIGITNTPIEIKATVTDTNETPLTNGTIIFTINDQIIAQSNIIDGTAITTITLTQEENITIKATYQKTKDYRTSSDEATITIQKPSTQINIEEVNLTAGQTVTLTATATDQAGNNINDGKVTFKVNGKTVKDANGKVVYAKVVDGVATAEYTVPDNLSGQNITITATYSGSTKHNKETATLTTSVATPEPTLTITPITDDIQTESTITLKAKVTQADNTITNGKIVFKINGKTVKDTNGKVIYAKVDSNGEVSIDYTLPESYKAGNYTIEAVFTAAGYEKISSNTTMNIVKA